MLIPPTTTPTSRVPLPENPLDGRFLLEKSLGAGKFGETFVATDLQAGTDAPRVAVKLYAPEFCAKETTLDKFSRKIQPWTVLKHPGVIWLRHWKLELGKAYLVTELAQEGSLAEWLRIRGKLNPALVQGYLYQLALGLDEAHLRGLVHGNLKPANILLDNLSGELKLADFGQNWLIEAVPGLEWLGLPGWSPPAYAAPEVWEGKVGKASDIYALGILLYQMLSGTLPFSGNWGELLRQHATSPLPDLPLSPFYGPKEAEAFKEVIVRACAKNPADRPGRAEQLYQLFQVACSQPDALTRPIPPDPRQEFLETLLRKLDRLSSQGNRRPEIELVERILKLDSKQAAVRRRGAEAYAWHGQSLLLAGDHEAALENLLRAIELNPEMTLAHYWLGQCYMRFTFWDKAIASLRRAIQLDPARQEFYLARAESYFHNHNFLSALDDIAKTLSFSPSYAAPHYWRGRCYYEQQNYDDALTSFNQAIKFDWLNADYYYWRGRTNYTRQDYNLAREDFKAAFRYSSEHAEAYFWLAKTYYNQNDYWQAADYFDAAIRLDHTRPEYYLARARNKHGQNLDRAAVGDLNRAIELAPHNAEAYFWRGRLEEENKFKDYNRAIELAPDRADYYLERAKYYAANKIYLLAVTDFNEVIQLEPDKQEYYFERGRNYYEAGEFERARVDFERAIQLDPHEANYYYWRGLCEWSLQRYDPAVADLTTATMLDHTKGLYFALRGKSFYKLGRYEESLTDYHRAVRLEPNNADHYYWRGQVYQARHQRKEARQEYDQAIKLGHKEARQARRILNLT